MGRHFRRWGAVYLLFALFLGSWIGQFFAQIADISAESEQHGQPFAWSDFWPHFLSATFENWQSEWLQLFVQAAVLLAMRHILFKAEAEDEEKIEGKLDALLRHAGLDPCAIEREIKARE